MERCGEKTMKKNKGFTLIELFIVIAIVGIVVAIAIPQFMKHKHGIDCSNYRGKLVETISDITSVDVNQETRSVTIHTVTGVYFYCPVNLTKGTIKYIKTYVYHKESTLCGVEEYYFKQEG